MMMFGLVGIWNFTPKLLWIILLILGIGLIVVAAAQWFRDLINESKVRHNEPPLVVDLGNRYGMIFFIVSEVMFFAAFFAAYFYLRAHQPVWPPANIAPMPIQLPVLITLVLLTSGATVTWAHHALVQNRMGSAQLGTFLTWQLGIIFLAIMLGVEYRHMPVGLDGGVYATTFYLLTGFHGFHVLVGSVMLMVAHRRLVLGHFVAKEHFYYEAAAWYWHFVDVVWVGLFLFLYVL
jgi:cytochrome c oxidase subunit III